MNIYFPIAEVSINLYFLIGVGVIVGMLSNIFGIGGGFLATPCLMSVGVPPYIATACSTQQVTGSSFMGVLTKINPVQFDAKLASMLAMFGILGSYIGVLLVQYLKNLGYVDILISLSYLIVMTATSFSIFMRFLFKNNSKNEAPSIIAKMPMQFYFESSGKSISIVFIGILGAFVGFLTGIMGIGGGFIMVPVMTYVLHLNKEKIIGTSLMQIFITTLFVTIMNVFYMESLDILLGVVLIVGGSVGAFIGGIISKYIKLDQTNFLLALLILTVALFFGIRLVKTPSSDDMFTIEAINQE